LHVIILYLTNKITRQKSYVTISCYAGNVPVSILWISIKDSVKKCKKTPRYPDDPFLALCPKNFRITASTSFPLVGLTYYNFRKIQGCFATKSLKVSI